MSNLLTLRYWDDPCLSTMCSKIEDNEFGPQLEEFGQDLIATMIKNKGVGLAAPQVGVTKRVFAMQQYPENSGDPRTIVVCNPELNLSGVMELGQEGCLSLPGIYSQVNRSTSLTMRYFTLLGEEKTLALYGLAARISQHENDHLDGIVFPFRLSRQSRRHALAQWNKVKHLYE